MCHYEALSRAIYNILTRCIGWRKHKPTDHSISYLNTLVKMVGKSIAAILRKRRILIVGLVRGMEDIGLSKYFMVGKLLGGAVPSGEEEEERKGCLLDSLRASVSRPTCG